MPLITETYYLSLTQDNRGILRLRCSQDDTLRTVNLKLYNNGSIFTIPSGISAYVSGVKQNGVVFSKSCTISQDRKSVVLQLSSNITNVDGVIIAEIVLNDGNGDRIGTSNFIIQVEKNPIRVGVIQDTETPIEYVNDFITQIQALTARLNNLITPSGDPSLAEVVDARISSLDNNTYQNLKARIDADIATLNTRKANKADVYTKAQVDTLLDNIEITVDDELSDESENPVQNKVINGAISELKADLDAQTGIIRLVKNYYIKTSTTPIDLTPVPSSAGRMYAVIDCTAGDKFVINAYSDFVGAKAWCFIDSSNNVLSMADEEKVTDLELIAPTNAVKLIINDKSGGMSYKVGNNLATKAGNGLSDDVKNNMFSMDAKYILAELLKNVVSTDENATQLYENLINAMGVDMLKENIFIYLPDQFGDLSLVQGSLVLESIGGVKHGLGINNNANMSSRYRVFGVSNGKSELQKYMGYQDESLFNLYPIPVPENATSAWIGVFPSSQYIISRLMRWDETNSSYAVVESENQRTEGNHIKTFSRGKNMFLALMSAYNGSNSTYADGPDAIVVVFKE